MHEVYATVGLEYRFARSSELYQGVERFKRIGKPQPGDLIVWRGHVGLVVDPEETTFYSSVGSGLKTESYHSPYWLRRGRPRFYRYRFEGNAKSPVMAAGLEADPLASLTIPDPAEHEPTTATRVEREGLVSEDAVTAASASSLPEDTAIAQALIAYADGATVQAAIQPDSFIIFEELRVDELKLQGNQATARLELHAAAAVAGESVNLRGKRIKVRLDLQRTSKGWLLRKPQPVCLSRRAGVCVLAERLAGLAATTPTRSSRHAWRGY